jgi:hypothetical protein
MKRINGNKLRVLTTGGMAVLWVPYHLEEAVGEVYSYREVTAQD